MNLSSMTRKFRQRKAIDMTYYTKKYELSPDANRAACTIVQGLMKKAQREKAIPTVYVFWTSTNDPEINNELRDAGFMRFVKREKGRDVWEHDPDPEALKRAIGWNVN